jgi:O-antigen ligase
MAAAVLDPVATTARRPRLLQGRAADTAPRVSPRLVVGFCLLFAVLKAGAAATTAAGALLCLYALAGAGQALKALSLVVVIKYLNPTLYTFSAEFGLIAWLILVLGGLRMFAAGFPRHFKGIVPLLGFSAVVGLLFAAQDNPHAAVSAMKLVMFTYGVAAILVGYAALKDKDVNGLATWLLSLNATVILLSLPTFAFPAVAYARNGMGFQGILNHPQSFGPLLAPLACWLFAGILFARPARLLKPVGFGLFLIALMILSQARTSVVVLLLSLGAAFLVMLFRRKRFSGFKIGRTLSVSLAAVLVLLVGFLSSAALRDKLVGFVFKYHTKTLDAALASRSGGIESQWQYFLQRPFTGHGFGVYPWGEFPSGIVEVWGIPISAPVEKGFLPTAILEETGLIGALALLVFLVALGKRVAGNGDARWLAVFFAGLFVNVGEMVLFSVGGIGLYYWLLVGLALRIRPEPLEAVPREDRKPPKVLRAGYGAPGSSPLATGANQA